jgi:hypothetical protein
VDDNQPPGALSTGQELMSRLLMVDSYGVLLVAIVLTYLTSAVDAGGRWNRVVISICYGCVLVIAAHTSKARPRTMQVAAVLAVAGVVISFLRTLVAPGTLDRASYLYLAAAFAAPAVVLNRVLRHPVINLETIMGAIDSYLLIGMAFALLYSALNRLDTQYFFVQSTKPTAVDFLYFSFVVLTTVGFGDLTPKTPIGKVIVPAEALLGQIFLVTIVAALVGNLGRERLSRRSPDEEE